MIKELLRNPTVVLPKQHIILVSHMRANTTLLAHIFGSHPAVSGYYEHHIGYYSWKSLVREKLKFLQENPREKSTRFYFDKVLHNEHYLCPSVLNRKNVSLLFMLRKPERTIKSIVSLYKKAQPEHEFTNADNATRYYIERLEYITDLAKSYSKSKTIVYLDAEDLIDNPVETLSHLSQCFQLKPQLSREYELFELSAKKRYGDSSENIKSGKISKQTNKYDEIKLDEALLASAEASYVNARNVLTSLSAG